jgi:hypothetical protein
LLGIAVAFATLIPKGDIYVLDDLWVEPEQIGRASGRGSFDAARTRRGASARRMDWEAEPNAVGFYKKMGAQGLRDSGRTMWGRVIDVMGVKLPLATSQ